MYVLVDAEDNIVRGPEVLPNRYIDADNVAHDLKAMSDDDLSALGWLQTTINQTEHDPRFEDLDMTCTRMGNRMIINFVPRYRDLQLLKIEKGKDIDAERERQIESGVDFKGHRFDTDREARQNITAMAAAITSSVELPDGFTWRSAGDINVPMTKQELLAFAATVMGHVNAIYVASWAAKAQLAEINEPSDVVSFDVTQHWPPISNI